MSTREIPPPEWDTFLTDFSRGHRAWLTTVERVRGGSAAIQASSRPLDAVHSERAGDRVVGITVRFQPDAAELSLLRIDAPVKLRVDQTEDGRARALEIEDAHGGCTRLRFRAAPPLEQLDGVAPGEVGINE